MFGLLFLFIMITLCFSNEYGEYGEYIGDNTYKMEEGDYIVYTHLFPVNSEDHHRRRLNHFWEDYKWKKTTSNLIITIGNCHTTSSVDWSSMLTDVIYNWNNVPENQDGSGEIYTPTNITFTAASNCASANIMSYNGNYGDTGWLGLATIYTSDNYVVAAISQINEYHSLTDSQWQHVLCQEIGHGFPLDHQSESGADKNTCMDYDNNLGNKYPNEHDVEILNILYGEDSNSDGSNDNDKNNDEDYDTMVIVWVLIFIITGTVITFCICGYLIYRCIICCCNEELDERERQFEGQQQYPYNPNSNYQPGQQGEMVYIP